MKNFRDMKFRILIATDVAARGIDVPHIEHVINYDLPQMAEDFIHRIGRTARAGSKGVALSFVTKGDFSKWKEIQKILNPEKHIKSQHKSKNKSSNKYISKKREDSRRPLFKKKSDYKKSFSKKSGDQGEKNYSKNKFKKNNTQDDFNSNTKVSFSRKKTNNKSSVKKNSSIRGQKNSSNGNAQTFNSPRKRRK